MPISEASAMPVGDSDLAGPALHIWTLRWLTLDQASARRLSFGTEDKVKPGASEEDPEGELWPPKPPNVYAFDFTPTLEPELFAVTANSQLSKVSGSRKVYKSGGTKHEFVMMSAAGECSVKAHGLSLVRNTLGQVMVMGYVMDLETPLEPKNVEPGQRKFLMDQMISVVLALHRKEIIHGDIKPANMLLCSDGKLRLCDFAEARRVDEALDSWEGTTTINYMSPLRCRNGTEGPGTPPTIEDDLYGLGLSIWELFAGKIPFEDDDMDDIINNVKTGQTVDVNEVEDEEVREIICKYLRRGGAKV
jgi:serine/threonine protein kinase